MDNWLDIMFAAFFTIVGTPCVLVLGVIAIVITCCVVVAPVQMIQEMKSTSPRKRGNLL